jgi:hypothetical protein
MENRCTISSPSEDPLEIYLELQDVARLIYNNRSILRNMKKQLSSLLTNKHKNMNKKELLNAFEGFFEEPACKKQPLI